MDRCIFLSRESGMNNGQLILTPKELILTNLSLRDVLIVPTQLTINENGNDYVSGQYYGVKFVQKLRNEYSFRGRIIFFGRDRIEDLMDDFPSFRIINTVGHTYIQSSNFPKEDTIEKALKSMRIMTENHLLVCKHQYIDTKGMSATLTHGLRSNVTSNGPYKNYLISIIEKLFKLYNQLGAKQTIDNFHNSFPSLNENNTNAAIDFVQDLSKEFSWKNGDEGDFRITLSPIAKWEVLWLDDEITEEHILYKTLNQFEELTIHLVSNVPDAVDIFKHDSVGKPKINVVIADYLLVEKIEVNGKSYLKDKKFQGYELLEYISKCNRPIKFVSLSSMQRLLQNKIAMSFSVPCDILPKKVFRYESEIGANYITEQVIQHGNEQWMSLSRRSNQKYWENSILPAYIKFTNSTGAKKRESEVSIQALDSIRKYESYKEGIIPKPKITARQSPLSYKYKDQFARIADAKSYTIGMIDSIFNSRVAEGKKEYELSTFLDENIEPEKSKELKKILDSLGLNFTHNKRAFNKFVTIRNTIGEELKDLNYTINQLDFADQRLMQNVQDIRDNDKFYKDVTELFVSRRILLYFAKVKGLDESDIANILGIKLNAYLKLRINWDLGMKSFLWESQIEEERWLIKHFDKELKLKGIDIKSDISDLLRIFSRIESAFCTYLQSLNNSKYESGVIQIKYVDQNFPIGFSNFTPNISSVEEVKALINELHQNLGNTPTEEAFRQFIKLWRKIYGIIINYRQRRGSEERISL